jgi:hypothetical protein
MVVAKRPGLGESSICWAAAVFGLDSKGERLGPSGRRPPPRR